MIKLKVVCDRINMSYNTVYRIEYANGLDEDIVTVDLRSDTITKPTQEMRDAMAVAEVGDAVYEEDPTVTQLEARSAALLGKEASLYVPSGTMANLLAIMVHCRERGSELICGDKGHTFKFEQGGPAFIAGVQSSTLKTNPDGTFSLEEMQSRLHEDPDCHQTISSLIVIENTHNLCGGRVLPLDWIDKLTTIARSHKVAVHMDGARLMNAAVASKIPTSRIVRDIDSVCFCLSKGLGCPVGSMLAGTKEFVAKAKRYRKALGGGMRQCGILAAAGLVALDKMIDRLQVDHDHTYRIAKAIEDLESDIFKVDMKSVQTNILLLYMDKNKVTPIEFLERLGTIHTTDTVKVNLRGMSLTKNSVRFILHHNITDTDVEFAIKKLQLVILEIQARIKLSNV